MNAQERQNLNIAIAAVKDELGLPASPLLWSYEQRLAYNKRLAAYIQENSNSFSAETNSTADYVANANYQQLEDTSLFANLSLFNDSIMASSLDVLNKFGGFVKLLVVLGIVLGVVYIIKFLRK